MLAAWRLLGWRSLTWRPEQRKVSLFLSVGISASLLQLPFQMVSVLPERVGDLGSEDAGREGVER